MERIALHSWVLIDHTVINKAKPCINVIKSIDSFVTKMQLHENETALAATKNKGNQTAKGKFTL